MEVRCTVLAGLVLTVVGEERAPASPKGAVELEEGRRPERVEKRRASTETGVTVLSALAFRRTDGQTDRQLLLMLL